MRKYQTFWKRLASTLIDSVLFLPYIFFASTHKYYYYGMELSYILIWTVYSVYCHGKYGQTLGKRLTGIMVVDVAETSFIGYKIAFLREALWFFVSLAVLIYAFMQSSEELYLSEEAIGQYDSLVTLISLGWLAIELITMWLNEKRRALHDFMAQSVVFNLSADDTTASPSSSSGM